MANGFCAQHQHGLADGIDLLAECRIHAAVCQPQYLLGQDRIRQHGARHVEFLVVFAAHGAQDGADGLGEAWHVALLARAFPQGRQGLFAQCAHWATCRGSSVIRDA